MVGENARTISDLMSSPPSKRPSKGEPSDDRANCGVDDRTERACGEAERIASSAVVVEIDGVGDDPFRVSASSASKDCVDSCSSGYRDLELTRAMPGEKDGGGFTGVPSLGDVMDTDCVVSI